MRFYALLDGPRVSGAYGFVVRPGTDTVLDVQARLFLRAPVATLGIAPLTSMFLAGENQPVAHDYRPEVHDSDGLLVASGRRRDDLAPADQPGAALRHLLRAERTARLRPDAARPCLQPATKTWRRTTSAGPAPGSSRSATGARGASSCCSSARRTKPTTTSPPTGCRQRLPPPGQPIDVAWRVHWTRDDAAGHDAGAGAADAARPRLRRRAAAAGAPAIARRLRRPGLQALPEGAAVEAVASANANVRALRANAYRHTERGGWRVSLDFERIDARQPVELRSAAAAGRQAAYRNLGLCPCTGVKP